MIRTRTPYWFAPLIVALTLAPAYLFAASTQNDEERLGRQYSTDIERGAKMVTDPSICERINRIGRELAQIANTTEVPALYGSSQVCPFEYQFKVIEDKDVNAFSLPGGYVYLNTGLIQLATSDDELAGVLAHEIAHASHHHLFCLIRRSSIADRYAALVALAGILGNVGTRDFSHLLMGAHMLKIGKLNTYTQEAERDADRTAVAYMVRAGYNPEGMLTFMKKLEAKHDQSPGLPLGIFQTHPATFRRVTSIARAMREEGLEPDLRRIDGTAYARSVEIEGTDARYRVVVGERVVYTPAGLGSGPGSRDRADGIAGRINSALDRGLRPSDIIQNRANRSLLAGGDEILRVEPEDLSGGSFDADAILQEAHSALEYAVWADWLRRGREADVNSDITP